MAWAPSSQSIATVVSWMAEPMRWMWMAWGVWQSLVGRRRLVYNPAPREETQV